MADGLCQSDPKDESRQSSKPEKQQVRKTKPVRSSLAQKPAGNRTRESSMGILLAKFSFFKRGWMDAISETAEAEGAHVSPATLSEGVSNFITCGLQLPEAALSQEFWEMEMHRS